jgi:hypothetical protein
MADGDTQIGSGSSFTFSGITGDLLSLSLGDMSRDSVEVHHMGTTGFRPKLFGVTDSTGTITAEIHFDTTEDGSTPIVAAAGSLVLNIGKAASDGSIYTYSSAAMTGYSWNDPLEDVLTATVEWELNSEAVIT